MKRSVDDGKDEGGGRPGPRDRRLPHRVGDRQRPGLGSVFVLSRPEMLERRDPLRVRPGRLEKS